MLMSENKKKSIMKFCVQALPYKHVGFLLAYIVQQKPYILKYGGLKYTYSDCHYSFLQLAASLSS
jgi:hypothetical protein